ncbi:hypothetical protein CRE_14120 [Caenorhabditis remanei]|uniref:Uncharacterized protein n=1 Tax=Caenorhabditis remanei TaxID=31234 RepID=E3MRC3_CAERE|nr:hypothetical protein CRE_14120 [Caenorhabditis remanei]
MSVFNKHSSFFQVEDTLTGGLRTRVNQTSPDQCLLFHAFWSKFCTHRRYTNPVRKVEDPLMGGLRTRVNQTSPDQCLLFHAFWSKFCTHRRYANPVRKVEDPLTGCLRTRVNQTSPDQCLLFHAFWSGKEFRSTNEAIMEVHATRLMANWRIHACLGASPLGRTSKTQEFDGQLGALELACAKANFPLNSEKPRNYSSKMPSWYGQTAPNTSYTADDQIQLSIKLLTVTNNYRVEMENR